MISVTLFPLVILGPAALALCADARRAMERAGISHKAAAIEMETRVPKLSAQLNGHEPFTLWCRFSMLGDVFWREFNVIRAERFGQHVVTQDIGRLIDTVDGLQKRMAWMTLPTQRERERA